MAKFMNIVRCKVKSSSREEYLKKIDERPKFDGQISAKYVETKPNEFFMIGEWNSEDDIAEARPKMIAIIFGLASAISSSEFHSPIIKNSLGLVSTYFAEICPSNFGRSSIFFKYSSLLDDFTLHLTIFINFAIFLLKRKFYQLNRNKE